MHLERFELSCLSAQPPQGCVHAISTTDAKNRRDPAVCKARIAVVAQLTGLEPAVSWFVAMCSHPIELQLHSFAEL